MTNTVERLKEIGITLDVSEETIKEVSSEDKFNVSYEEVKKMSAEDRNALSKEAMDYMDSHWYGDGTCSDVAYKCYSLINSIIDEEYREENMEEFKAYEARMNEPDFDWDYYSDWHKDMFGYRPHKAVIPQSEEERHQIFEDFHRQRGL